MELIFDKSGFGGVKGPVIYRKEENTLKPILYIRKAKHATDEEFEQVINFLTKHKK